MDCSHLKKILIVTYLGTVVFGYVQGQKKMVKKSNKDQNALCKSMKVRLPAVVDLIDELVCSKVSTTEVDNVKNSLLQSPFQLTLNGFTGETLKDMTLPEKSVDFCKVANSPHLNAVDNEASGFLKAVRKRLYFINNQMLRTIDRKAFSEMDELEILVIVSSPLLVKVDLDLSKSKNLKLIDISNTGLKNMERPKLHPEVDIAKTIINLRKNAKLRCYCQMAWIVSFDHKNVFCSEPVLLDPKNVPSKQDFEICTIVAVGQSKSFATTLKLSSNLLFNLFLYFYANL